MISEKKLEALLTLVSDMDELPGTPDALDRIINTASENEMFEDELDYVAAARKEEVGRKKENEF